MRRSVTPLMHDGLFSLPAARKAIIWGKAGTRLLIAAFEHMTFHPWPAGSPAGAGVFD